MDHDGRSRKNQQNVTLLNDPKTPTARALRAFYCLRYVQEYVQNKVKQRRNNTETKYVRTKCFDSLLTIFYSL